jgi:uncharacterized protein YndB with AHSA1/START domain
MRRVEVERYIPHPIERVFRRYTDHAGWTEWAGFGRVWLTREGSTERDGVGAVRAFSTAPRLREEVTRFEPPTRMEYRVVRGAPIRDHHGEVLFASEGSGTRLTWRISFRSSIPGLGWPMERFITVLFRRMLAALARDLDSRDR